ncbi:hypothetical protein HDU87_000195 [Geranomyces variabilis]|uniref:Uncharacterized protein n=1 Tax=Geranomyces variabilis TaxID=109894 RepID=A0AAD5TSH3_9FUNG|nr:hypothetical protein HDU87_000195 [Geranomyces variabilis]
MSIGTPLAVTAALWFRDRQSEARRQFSTSSMWSCPTASSSLAGPASPGFVLRNDYPATESLRAAETEQRAWEQVDWTTEPHKYLLALRDYCLEGNEDVDFAVARNAKRDWWHAPWLHTGRGGRDPLHGLTQERPIQPYELSDRQHRKAQTWACGYFNAPAASVLGKIWKDPTRPDVTDEIFFPPGSVIFKLLFSQATSDEMPLLEGAPVWNAVIIDEKTQERSMEATALRLVQMDVMAKDPRLEGRWIFATYIFCAGSSASNVSTQKKAHLRFRIKHSDKQICI